MADIFSISDSESEPLEEVGSWEMDQSVSVQDMNTVLGHSLTGPALRLAGELGNRVRMNSESQASTSCGEWDEQFQGRGSGEDDMPADGAPFRGRSQSAPPALWAAKKYGRQLRRMSDEFDVWLDKGEMKRVRSAGGAKQMHQSPSWWAFLFSHQETEGETPHNNLTSTEPRASE